MSAGAPRVATRRGSTSSTGLPTPLRTPSGSKRMCSNGREALRFNEAGRPKCRADVNHHESSRLPGPLVSGSPIITRRAPIRRRVGMHRTHATGSYWLAARSRSSSPHTSTSSGPAAATAAAARRRRRAAGLPAALARAQRRQAPRRRQAVQGDRERRRCVRVQGLGGNHARPRCAARGVDDGAHRLGCPTDVADEAMTRIDVEALSTRFPRATARSRGSA